MLLLLSVVCREGNDYGHERAMTYQQVLDETCRLVSGALTGRGSGLLESGVVGGPDRLL